ncbi:NAD(P)/FAD-dependent oxidoreductase [Actinoplanes sp. NPDC051411]|uniref:FAD-dependent oxidoreductase n=1 Tax=Actinoplanes sp. NPDC051411 TaxID=3155522 RepID=UPI003420FCBF
MVNEQPAELLVVGAGPAGLTAALAARSLGIDVTLIEADPQDRERAGSRALFVHHETLNRLQRLSPGLGDKIAGFGITWEYARTFYGDREVYSRRYTSSPGVGLPPYASLRQLDTERFLRDACQGAGVRAVWDAAVEEVRSGPEDVTVRTRDGREWTSDYLIAADGARSTVRTRMGIEMDGDRSDDYRIAVDLADDPANHGSAECVMYYRHPALDGRNVLVVPFAGGIQADVQCRGREDSERLSTPEAVRRWIPQVVPAGYRDRVLWIARYPCLQRVATSFVDRHRRVLLTGEAAHLFAPLGARGMNSAMADAESASTAVGVALRAAGSERARAAVEEFDRLRRQAAHHNRARVERAVRHLRADSPVQRLRQAGAARLAPLLPGAGAWLHRAPYGPRGSVTVTTGLY